MTHLDRRTLLQAGAASAAMLAAPRALAQTPKSGGTLRVGVSQGAPSDSLDPGALGDMFKTTLSFTRADTLTEVAPDGSLRPELALSWEGSNGAKTWTFELRRDVEFHSGAPLTAADVIATVNYHTREDANSGAKSLLANLESMRADGPHTVVFELKTGAADFPFMLGDYYLIIHQAHEQDGIDWRSGKGTTGAYILDNYEPGVRASLTRNPNYWKSDAGYFDAVELLSITDPAARTNALMTGAVDVIEAVDLGVVSRLRRRRGLEIDVVNGPMHLCLPMHCDAAPFNDVNVRLAMKHGVNRVEFLDKILKGFGALGNDHPIGDSYRYAADADEIPQRAYDPDRSRYHLRQAGLDRVSVDLHVSNAAFADAVDGAVLYQESARAAGIDITVKREPDSGYWSSVWDKKPFITSYWGGRATEDIMMSVAYESTANYNDTNWSNERFDALLRAARTELEDARRREMYVEMQRLIHDDGGMIIPAFASYVSARSSRLAHGPQLSGARALDGGRVATRWWFA